MMIWPSGRSTPSLNPRSRTSWSSLMYRGNRRKPMREDTGICADRGNSFLVWPSVGGDSHSSAPNGFHFRFLYAAALHSLKGCRNARTDRSSAAGPCIAARLSSVTLNVCGGRTFVASNRTRRPSRRAAATSVTSTVGSCAGRPKVANSAWNASQSSPSIPPACSRTSLVRFSAEGPCGACFRGNDSMRRFRISCFLPSGTKGAICPHLESCIAESITCGGSGLLNRC
mmetsp:Transcript_129712/g.361272  ORF Transcript_129712/g.361272 Transcript_129712/m.361272 type:complete len:228 (-) Transcript_129712:319-1002(-)